MMKRLVVLLCGLLLTVGYGSAWAQAPGSAPAQSASAWTVAATAGAGGVQRMKLSGGLRLERSWTERVALVARVDTAKDSVSRRRLSMATSLASFVTTSRGVAMSSDVEAPTWYAGVGVSWRARSRGWSPVIAIDGGLGGVTLTPAFRVAGSDVTLTASSYGLTLGRDLTGRTTGAAGGVGLGISIPRGRWGLEAGTRMTLIDTPAEATRLITFGLSAAYRF